MSGLSSVEAERRLRQYGQNRFAASRQSRLVLLLLQFRSPITLLLAAAAALSLFLGDITDAVIILAIILVSGLLGFWQEKGAADAIRKLLALVSVQVTVVRDDRQTVVPVEAVVPGDMVVLSAGSKIPGDCLLLEAKDLFVNEAAMTGETYPVEKQTDTVLADTPLAGRTNSLFLGTHVVSGTAKAACYPHRTLNRVRQDFSEVEAASARDGVRTRRAPLWLLSFGSNAALCPGDLYRQCGASSGQCWNRSCSPWHLPWE